MGIYKRIEEIRFQLADYPFFVLKILTLKKTDRQFLGCGSSIKQSSRVSTLECRQKCLRILNRITLTLDLSLLGVNIK